MDFLSQEGVYQVDLSLIHNSYNQRIPAMLRLDLQPIYKIESRKEELASVNQQRAPELSSALGRGRSLAAEMFVQVSYIVNSIGNAIKKREAVVILDEAPRVLAEKGLVNARSPGGAADYRTAAVNADGEYQTLQDLYEQLRSIRALIQVKMEGLEKAFYAVQNIYRVQKSFGLEDSHLDLSGSSDKAFVTNDSDDKFFGKARV